MASILGSAVFSASVFFYALGLIFSIVGFVGPWLEPPRKAQSGITNIGLRQACFNTYAFPNDAKSFDGCYDVSRNSEDFLQFNPREMVSPAWFQMVQEMHLAAMILVALTLILIISFLISYCTLKRQVKKRQRPSSCLLISKCGFALWFVFTTILSILMIVEPVVFYHNYELNREIFFRTSESYVYGPAFAITVASAVSFIISTILSLIVFCTICKKMIRLSSGGPKTVYADEFDELDPQTTEMEQLSHEESDDHLENTQPRIIVKRGYQSEPEAKPSNPPTAKPRTKSITEADRSYQNIPGRGQVTPTTSEPNLPYQNIRSGGQTRAEPQGQSYQNIPASSGPAGGQPVPAKRKSLILEKESKNKFDAPGMVPVYGGYSSAVEPPSDISGPQSTYAPSTHYSYNPRHESDTESFVRDDGRNRSRTRATGVPGSRPPGNGSQLSEQSGQPNRVINAKPADIKHSRYAAY